MSTPLSRMRGKINHANGPMKRTVLRIPERMLNCLNEIAEIRGVPFGFLVRMYIGTGIREDFNLIENLECRDRLFNCLFKKGMPVDEIRMMQDEIYPKYLDTKI